MKKTILALILVLCLLSTGGLAEAVRSLPEDETITITILEGVNSNKENIAVEQAVQERLNIKLEYTYVPSANFDEKINTVLASGELPDVISFLW